MEGVHSIMVMITQFDTETKSRKNLQVTFKRKNFFLDADSIETKESALKFWKFMDENGFLSDWSKVDRAILKNDPLTGLRTHPYSAIEETFLSHGLVVTAYHERVDKQNNQIITAFFSKLNLD